MCLNVETELRSRVLASRGSGRVSRYWAFSRTLGFFPGRGRHTRCSGDWSSDVCSPDLKALARAPVTPAELAAQTRTDERYLREWLASQAAGGYINYDEKTGTFSLSQEQAFALANEDSPAYLPGAFELALGSLAAVPRIAESFRTGAGMGWHEHVDGVFHGCEKFFRPGYAANLVSSWIPALHDV